MSADGLGPAGRQPGAIERALRLLAVVAAAEPGITAQQVAHRLGVPAATTYRLLNLLVAEEYVVRLPDLRGFALGRRALELTGTGLPVAGPPGLPPGLSALVRHAAGGLPVGVHLARFSGGRLVELRSDDPHGTRPADLGEAELDAHRHACAIGKVLLATVRHAPGRPVPARCDLPAVTARTITDPQRLAAELDRVRAEGVSLQDGELRAGLACVAAPVLGPDGGVTGALGLSVPSGGLVVHEPLLRRLARHGAELTAAAWQVAR